MTRLIGLAAAAAVLVAAPLAFSRPSGMDTRPRSVFYGHITSMHRAHGGLELRFDPAWWLTGRAAEQAAYEDHGSRDVPNDYYIVDEGHRLLTFPVARRADVTVLVGGGSKRVQISATELSQIVNGRNPRHRHLSEPKAGFWIRIGNAYPNPAVELFQQYQP